VIAVTDTADAASATAAVVARDVTLPALGVLFDEQALRAALGVEDGAPSTVRVRRLRYKPGTSVQAALEVGDADDAQWLLFAGYGHGGAPKGEKDEEVAGRRHRPAVAVDVVARWTVVPAWSDRSFRPSAVDRAIALGAATTLSYNPRRRLVVSGRSAAHGDFVAKLYKPGTPQATAHVLDALYRGGAPVPAPLCSPHRTVVVAGRVDGVHADPVSDGWAIAEALGRLAATGRGETSIVAPRWGGAELIADVSRALRFVARILPDLVLDLDALIVAIAGHREELDRLSPALLHGDLSPDQVMMTDRGAVLVDLDACAIGPSGWDRATWLAAQAAAGGPPPTPLPGVPPHPLLVAAALALRAPEPFRRNRPDWPARTTALVAAGLDAAGRG